MAHAKKQAHPEFPDKTIFEVFEAEREQLIPYRGPFDAYRSTPASVSKTCLVRFDNNKYSVMSTAVGRPVDVYAYADRIVIKQNGDGRRRASALDSRATTSIQSLALRAGADEEARRLAQRRTVQGLELPGALGRVRRKLKGVTDGDRQMVDILTAVLTDGLAARGGSLRGGACRWHAQCRCDPEHPGATQRSGTSLGRCHTGAACICRCCLAPIALATTACDHRPIPPRACRSRHVGGLMERSEILEMMATLQLSGMRAAYDEIVTTGIKRKHSDRPASLVRCSRPRSPRSRRARSATRWGSPSCRWPRSSPTSSSRVRRSTSSWCAIWPAATSSRSSATSSRSAAPAPARATLPSASRRSCIRLGRKARFFNVVDLVNKLEAEAKLGRAGRIADGLTRVDLVVLDELGYLPFAQSRAASCCST